MGKRKGGDAVMSFRKQSWFKTFVGGGAAMTLVLASPVGCKSKDDVGSMATTSAPAELKVVPAEVEKITIKDAARSEIVFEKREGSWIVASPPPSGPANTEAVQALLQNLSETKIKEQISASASPEDLSLYELTPDKAMHVVVGRGGSTIADLWFGKSGARGQMLRVGNNKGIWAASGYSSYLYSRDIKMWRDSDELRAYKAQAAAKAVAEDAKCLKWSTICTLGRFPDGSERTTGTQSYPTKAACEQASKAFNVPCDPCKCY